MSAKTACKVCIIDQFICCCMFICAPDHCIHCLFIRIRIFMLYVYISMCQLFTCKNSLLSL